MMKLLKVVDDNNSEMNAINRSVHCIDKDYAFKLVCYIEQRGKFHLF